LDTLTGENIDWEEFGRLYNGQSSYGRRVQELFNIHTSHLPNTFDRP